MFDNVINQANLELEKKESTVKILQKVIRICILS